MDYTERDPIYLSYFWDLASENIDTRQLAAYNIILFIKKSNNKENVYYYTLKRLIKGLKSSRDAARQGFSTCLIEIINLLPIIDDKYDMKELFKYVDEYMHITGSVKRSEERDMLFGKLFVYLSIIKSNALYKLTSSIDLYKELLDRLIELYKKKNWLQEIIIDLFIEFLNHMNYKLIINYISIYLPIFYSNSDSLNQSTKTISSYTVNQLLLLFELKYVSNNRDNKNLTNAIDSHIRISDIKLTNELLESIKPTLLAAAKDYPKIHRIWDFIIGEVFPLNNNRELSTSRLESITSEQESYLHNLLDFINELFIISHEKRSVAMHLIIQLIAICPVNYLSFCITEPFVSCLVTIRSSKTHLLYGLGQQIISQLVVSVRSSSELTLSTVSTIIKYSGAHFDKQTGTNTIADLISSLDYNSIEKYIEYLYQFIYTSIINSSTNGLKQFHGLIDSLLELCHFKSKLPSFGNIYLLVIGILLRLGVFKFDTKLENLLDSKVNEEVDNKSDKKKKKKKDKHSDRDLDSIIINNETSNQLDDLKTNPTINQIVSHLVRFEKTFTDEKIDKHIVKEIIDYSRHKLSNLLSIDLSNYSINKINSLSDNSKTQVDNEKSIIDLFHDLTNYLSNYLSFSNSQIDKDLYQSIYKTISSKRSSNKIANSLINILSNSIIFFLTIPSSKGNDFDISILSDIQLTINQYIESQNQVDNNIDSKIDRKVTISSNELQIYQSFYQLIIQLLSTPSDGNVKKIKESIKIFYNLISKKHYIDRDFIDGILDTISNIEVSNESGSESDSNTSSDEDTENDSDSDDEIDRDVDKSIVKDILNSSTNDDNAMEDSDRESVEEGYVLHTEEADDALVEMIKQKQLTRKSILLSTQRSDYLLRTRAIDVLEAVISSIDKEGDLVIYILENLLTFYKKVVTFNHKQKSVQESLGYENKIKSLIENKILIKKKVVISSNLIESKDALTLFELLDYNISKSIYPSVKSISCDVLIYIYRIIYYNSNNLLDSHIDINISTNTPTYLLDVTTDDSTNYLTSYPSEYITKYLTNYLSFNESANTLNNYLTIYLLNLYNKYIYKKTNNFPIYLFNTLVNKYVDISTHFSLIHLSTHLLLYSKSNYLSLDSLRLTSEIIKRYNSCNSNNKSKLMFIYNNILIYYLIKYLDREIVNKTDSKQFDGIDNELDSKVDINIDNEVDIKKDSQLVSKADIKTEKENNATITSKDNKRAKQILVYYKEILSMYKTIYSSKQEIKESIEQLIDDETINQLYKHLLDKLNSFISIYSSNKSINQIHENLENIINQIISSRKPDSDVDNQVDSNADTKVGKDIKKKSKKQKRPLELEESNESIIESNEIKKKKKSKKDKK